MAFAAVLAVLSFLPSAPPTGALPLVRGAGVITSVSGGDSIQASLPGRFRYMAVEGPAGLTREQFLAAEVRFLRRRRWTHEQSDVFVGLSVVPKSVPITTPGADVELDSPDGSTYTAMSAAANRLDASQQLSGTPLAGSTTVARALAKHRPTLIILLGNGRHT